MRDNGRGGLIRVVAIFLFVLFGRFILPTEGMCMHASPSYFFFFNLVIKFIMNICIRITIDRRKIDSIFNRLSSAT